MTARLYCPEHEISVYGKRCILCALSRAEHRQRRRERRQTARAVRVRRP